MSRSQRLIGVDMNGNATLELLEDEILLLEAHAASSAYVMRKAFENARPLREFRQHPEIGSELADRIAGMAAAPAVDPIRLSAHVYALELTGADDHLRRAIKAILGNGTLRADEMVGQFTGRVAERLANPRKRRPPDAQLDVAELERLAEDL